MNEENGDRPSVVQWVAIVAFVAIAVGLRLWGVYRDAERWRLFLLYRDAWLLGLGLLLLLGIVARWLLGLRNGTGGK